MKKTFTQYFKLLVFCVAVLLSGRASASHIMGSDISYRCLGGNQYQVIVTIYRDCSGIDVPTTIPVSVQSNCGTQSITCTQEAATSGIEVSQLCPTAISTCQGGSLPGVEVYTYLGTVTITPNCGIYTFTYSDCCRNPSNNIVNSTAEGFMVRATLNSNLVGCENAPTFTSLPVPYFCLNQNVFYSHGALDIDGDSLVYTLIAPLDDAGGNIGYNAPYTATNPMPTTGGFNFDVNTGQLNFSSSQQGVYVVDVLVSEYRNGVLIGTTMRDIQIVVINCTNNPPTVSNCLTISNVSGAVVNSCNSLGVCPGQTVNFSFPAFDADGQPLTVTSNIGAAIPGATLTTTQVGGPDSVLISFNWTPMGTDTGFRYFTVQVEDNACPITGLQTFSFGIIVLDGTDAGPDRFYCTGGGPLQINAYGGNHFSWTPTTGIISANTDSSIVMVAPSANTSYIITSDLQGGCKNRDTVTVYNVPTFSTSTSSPDDTICLNASTTVSVNATPANYGPFTYSWGPANAGVQSPGAQTTSVRPSGTTSYQVTVTSAAGCAIKDSIQIVVQGVAPKIVVTPSANYVCPGTTVNLTSIVKALNCGPVANPLDPCLPGSTFALQDMGAGTGNANINVTPYPGFYMDSRVQYLYRASELQAMGLGAGTITDIGFNVSAKNSTQPYNNFSVKMGCTNLTELPTTYANGLSTVINPMAYSTNTGWNTHTLDVPYSWDGFSNLIIEVCYDNSSYTGYDNVFYSTTPFNNSVLWQVQDLSTGSGCTSLVAPYAGQNRPNTRFVMCIAPLNNYQFTWTGTDGTTLPDTSAPSVTINHNVDYTVVISDGTCQGDTTLSLFVDSVVLINAGPDTLVCNNSPAQLNGRLLSQATLQCVSNYTVASIPYGLIAPTGTVTNVTNFSGGLDDGITPAIAMPFPFNFYCQPVTNFYICTNGFVSFTGGSSTFILTALPNNTLPNSMVALFWRDLNLNSGGTVSYFTNGTAPNRVLVIRFTNVSFYGGGGTVNGELHIFENGNIEAHYTSFTGSTYVMGVENAAGTVATTLPGANNQNVTFTTPAAFRYTPVYTGSQLTSLVWTPNTGLSNDTIFNPVANPPATQTYVLSATFTGGCVTTDSVTVTLGSFPHSVSVQPDTICPGDTVQLTFTGAGVSYNWSPAATVLNPAAQSPKAVPYANTQFTVIAYDATGCRVDDTLNVAIKFHTPITLGPDTGICPYDFITLTPSGAPYLSYEWSTGANTPSITTAGQTTAAQDYFVRVDDGTCRFFSDTVTITRYSTAPLLVQPSGDTGICIGSSIILYADAGYTGYLWNTGSTNSQIVVSVAGDYYYTATDGHGCVLHSVDSAHVSVNPQPAATILTPYDSICEGQSTTVLYVNPVNGVTYTWNGTVTADSFKVATAGTYTLVASNNGCTNTATITIGSTNPQVVDLGVDRSFCGCDTSAILTSNVSGTYVWSTADTTQSIAVTGSGNYSVTVTDNNGCTAVDNIVVDIRCLTVEAIVADPTTGTVLSGHNAGLDVASTSYAGNFTYVWSPSAFLDDSTKKSPAVQAPTNTTTYQVIVTDLTYGCMAMDTVTLAVVPPGLLPMPNAFTPNGDGLNDTYGPLIPGNLQAFWTIAEFRIYNRWGQLVFNSNTNWDGNFNGTAQPADTYVYYITLTGPDQNNPGVNIQYHLTGSFTLLH